MFPGEVNKYQEYYLPLFRNCRRIHMKSLAGRMSFGRGINAAL